MKLFYLIIFNILFINSIFAQVAWMEPADATVDSTVTIYFDATQGDQGLMGFTGDVYAHTGVITTESANDSDWQHVVAGWGTANDTVLMENIGTDLYSISFQIRSFYGIDTSETVLKLAFVFRNADGSMSGRSADGSDVFIPLQISNTWSYQSYNTTENGLNIQTSGGSIEFTTFESGLRTSILPTGQAAGASHAISASPVSASFVMTENGTTLQATWNEWEIIIDTGTLKIDFIHGDTLTSLSNFFPHENGSGGMLTFSIKPEAKVYGGGSRALPYNLKGYNIDFYNQAHYGYSNFTTNLNTSIPILATDDHFAWIFDNHYMSEADIGAGSPGQLNYQTNGGTLRFLLTAGNAFSQLSENLSDLTGHAPLPPLWGLGYIQSRYGYETQDEAESIVSQMQAGNFPMDALVLDLYWFGGTSHMGDFNWDLSRFPDPEGMMLDFENQGIETILITEPYFTLSSDLYNEAASLNHFAEQDNGEPFVLYGFWAGDASLFDMTSDDAKEWLWPYYKNLFDMGAGGLWTDLGEPETHPQEMIHEGGMAGDVHNLFNNMWSEMLYNKTGEHFPDERLFNLTRSGYTGMQRYSTYPWSGDIQRSFEGLRAQIPIMLHMGMSGIGYMHSDLGGFTGGGQNSELYTRWMQLGVFSPVMRAHGTGVPPEPIFYDNQTQNIVRDAIELRYQFLPYNYTLAWEYSTKGTPLARPMNYYETSAALNELNDQFLWGKDVLVAPVLEEYQTSRMITFPNGMWYNYYDGTKHNGSQTISVEAPLNSIPLFIRRGGLIVQSNEKLMHSKSYDSDSVRILHAINADNATTERFWYHDDGVSPENLAQNQFDLIKLTGTSGSNYTSLTLEMEENHIASIARNVELKLYGFSEVPGNVTINGFNIPTVNSASNYENTTPSAWWDGDYMFVHFNWKDTTTVIEIDKEPALIAQAGMQQKLQITANPNPVNHNTKLEIITKQSGYYRFTIVNTSGKIKGTHSLYLDAGSNVVDLTNITTDVDGLAAGVYVLHIHSPRENGYLQFVKTE